MLAEFWCVAINGKSESLMKFNPLYMITGIAAACGIGASAMGSEFMINQMVDAYCSIMEGENVGVMNSYDRGMNEGMAIGLVMGQYPEKIDQLASMSEQEINSQFYPGIEQRCPQYSFGVK